MTYLILNLFFLLPALAIALWACLRLQRDQRKVILAAAAGAAVVVLVLTAVFDSIMIAVGLMAYSPDLRSGITIGLAPLEDFAYPVAAVLLLPALWILLGLGRPAEKPGDHSGKPLS